MREGFGIRGFVGSHLVGFLLANGAGAGLVRDLTRVENLHAVCAKVRLFEADVCEAACGEAIVADVRAASHGANGAN